MTENCHSTSNVSDYLFDSLSPDSEFAVFNSMFFEDEGFDTCSSSCFEEEKIEFESQAQHLKRGQAEVEQFWIALLKVTLNSHSLGISGQEVLDQLQLFFDSVIDNLKNRGALCLESKNLGTRKNMLAGIVQSLGKRLGPLTLIWSLDLLRLISLLGHYLDDVREAEQVVTVPLQLHRLKLMFPDLYQTLAESARRYDPEELVAALKTWSQCFGDEVDSEKAMRQMYEGLELLNAISFQR